MQHNLVNPYIVALNTAMPGESKALEDGYIHKIFERCSNECREEAVKLKADSLKKEIDNLRDNVQSARKQPNYTYSRIRNLAYQLAQVQESLQHGGGSYNMCYEEIEKYVLGENQAEIEREVRQKEIAAADARYAAYQAATYGPLHDFLDAVNKQDSERLKTNLWSAGIRTLEDLKKAVQAGKTAYQLHIYPEKIYQDMKDRLRQMANEQAT